MTETNVVEMVKNPEAKLIMGLIPCANRLYLGAVWPIIQSGVAELSEGSLGEWDEWRVFREVYAGTMQLYVGYLDTTNTVTPERFQEVFVEKLKTPEKDYVGFTILQFLDTSVHIFAVYIVPEYRQSNILSLGFNFIESEVRKMKAPYISITTHPYISKMLKGLGFIEQHMNYRKKL